MTTEPGHGHNQRTRSTGVIGSDRSCVSGPVIRVCDRSASCGSIESVGPGRRAARSGEPDDMSSRTPQETPRDTAGYAADTSQRRAAAPSPTTAVDAPRSVTAPNRDRNHLTAAAATDLPAATDTTRISRIPTSTPPAGPLNTATVATAAMRPGAAIDAQLAGYAAGPATSSRRSPEKYGDRYDCPSARRPSAPPQHPATAYPPPPPPPQKIRGGGTLARPLAPEQFLSPKPQKPLVRPFGLCANGFGPFRCSGGIRMTARSAPSLANVAKRGDRPRPCGLRARIGKR